MFDREIENLLNEFGLNEDVENFDADEDVAFYELDNEWEW